MKDGSAAQMVKGFGTFGTAGGAGRSALSGDSPVKNWGGVGILDMGKESANKVAAAAYDAKYKTKKYACAVCPLGCGAHYQVNEGKWPLKETDRPEYETLAAFGSMTLVDDAEAIIKCNDICNKYGLDTISVGATVAWAMECYEKGLISEKETEGIELSWGNANAMVAMTQAIADQTGFGTVLALGSAGAAKKIGKGTEYLLTVRGIELPMHDPRYSPGYARTYQYDPTPGRHVKGGLGGANLFAPPEIRYNYIGRGDKDARLTFSNEFFNAAGLCLFGRFIMQRDDANAYIAAATGWDFNEEEAMRIGKRIINMRYAFNLREGQLPSENTLPSRCIGESPQTEGPLKDITIDHQALAEQFFENVGWDKESLLPTRESLENLGGMEDVIQQIYG
ncbi:aldehyde ferredoxin oxidoreductase C-terminal domain-containing protein [Thermodesulfobacteriota bacterium]